MTRQIMRRVVYAIAALLVGVAAYVAPAPANMPGTFMPIVGAPTPACAGGTISYVNGKVIHKFTASGTLTCTRGGNVDYLVVAGGGGGGKGGGNTSSNGGGGGGGGGGVLAGAVSISSGNYSIVVGNGGAGATTNTVSADDGGNSSALGFTAIGGGGGALNNVATNGRPGGSGSGGSGSGLTATTGGSGTVGQGYDGGSNTVGSNKCGGGGGGAGSTAVAGSNTVGGSGGNGLSSLISGTLATYAGGGGGGCTTGGSPGTGGAGGGGNGGASGAVGGSGVTGLGGGGGAGGSVNGTTGANGGNGGSGSVIVAYDGVRDISTPTLVQLNSNTTALTTITSFTFTGQNLGAVDSNRYLILSLAGGRASSNDTDFASVTIDGVAATKIGSIHANQMCSVFIANVPTNNTTGTIAITSNGQPLSSVAFALYRVVTPNVLSVYSTGNSTTLVSSRSFTTTVDVPDGGFVIANTASWVTGTVARTVSWVGANVEFNVSTGSTAGYPSGASVYGLSAQAGRTITATNSANVTEGCVYAASF